MKYPAVFAIVIGVMMILQWIFFLITGQVPELQSAPWEIACHIFAEMLTAVVLIGGGTGLLRRSGWAKTITLTGLGMVVYSSINSSGYFAQSGQWLFIGMFAILVILSCIAIFRILRSDQVTDQARA